MLTSVFVVQAVCASGEATQDSVARPNIVILYADDMGWGGEVGPQKSLDAIKKECKDSVTFQ